MLWIHPAMQVLATLIGIYAAYLGMKRFLSQHLSMRRQFLWNRHVALGAAAIVLWLAGLIGGFAVARIKWQVNFVTGDHYETALAMLPLLFFGGLSGLYMHRNKARRRVLPLLHGLCNVVLVGQALYQFKTGWQVIKDFVL
ncbi:DUF4079 family protein [Pseudodesulfovibrio cashew]|uniref:DUF4079 family protein n=1 Tax=Pseudodesulfovibrio cashew TaxID=2678688 RepID=A0A6I6JDJ4_9BACT|nr:DUF4079 family protein [Pseudodesulfovibrio cashew]QGY39140.1 DUF4079 family protein [Pseudodesulfovibrio cashew]